MAVERLADELLGMILVPSLSISHNQLVSSSVTKFGKNDMVSSASVLLVCKRWLRVATPLLYETVIIRSIGQSRALAAVFSRNPAFASRVKNIRLEGAYASLMTVLQPCKNLVTLVLFLNIYSDTNVTDLCRVLPLINPVEVIVHDTRDKDNAKIRSVLIALCDAIPKWTALTSFGFPYGEKTGLAPADRGSHTPQRDRLIDALMKSKSLKVFFSSLSQLEADQWRRLARNSSVSFKFYYRPDNFLSPERLLQYAHNKIMESMPSFASRVEFIKHSEDTEYREPAPRCNNRFITNCRVFSSETVNDEIWRTILAFAAALESLHPPWPEILVWAGPRIVNATRKAISLACKRFERLVRPIFFATPMLPSSASLKAFTQKIVEQPHLGCLVHTLTFSGHHPITWHHNTELFLELIPHLTLLRHFHCGGSHHDGDPARILGCLARSAGDTLLTISGVGRGPSPPQSLSITMFASFKVLKTLELPHVGVISDIGTHLPWQPFACLSSLETHAYGDIWNAICTIRFPALKSVSLFCPHGLLQMENFLRASGSKIEHIRLTGFVDFAEVLSLASNLLSIDWKPRLVEPDCSSLMEKSLNKSAAHAKLEIFTIQSVFAAKTTEKDHNSLVAMIFDGFVLHEFPSLKEIHFPAYAWPVDERSVSRHQLPKKAVEVKRTYNIDITDESGKPWRVRTQ